MGPGHNFSGSRGRWVDEQEEEEREDVGKIVLSQTPSPNESDDEDANKGMVKVKVARQSRYLGLLVMGPLTPC